MAGKKIKFELEFLIKTSPKILYNCISTPSGLSEWFADDVNIQKDLFTFFWNDAEEKAKRIAEKQGEYVRFRWVEEEDSKAFFEFKIKIDSMTNEVALIITDFAEDDEKEEAVLLWESQVEELRHKLGS